jgi:hypothetical protein
MLRLKVIGDMRGLVGRCVYGTANEDLRALGDDCPCCRS